MNHLSPAECVDAAERALAPSRAAHLDGCPRCRDQVTAVSEALAATRAVGAPEPSPLFWQHFSARVRDRVAGETFMPAWRADGWRGLFAARAVMPAVVVAVLLAVVFAAGTLRESRPAGLAPIAPPPATLAAEAVEPENSDVWLVLTSAAADMPLDEAHAAGMGVPTGAVDRAVQRMTPDELTELGRLLQTQMRGSSN